MQQSILHHWIYVTSAASTIGYYLKLSAYVINVNNAFGIKHVPVALTSRNLGNSWEEKPG